MDEPRTAGGMQPVQPVMAHELVLEQVRTAIALGRYGPGDKLPRERDLAIMLRVSRATVREAMAVLAGTGEIEIRRGRNGGLLVRDVEVDEVAIRQNLRANRKQLQKIFEYRRIIESAGARLAAENRTKSDLDTMRKLVRQMQEVVGSHSDYNPTTVARFQCLDHEFHLQIAQSGKNPWLIDATSMTRVEMFRPVGGVFRRLEPTANHFHEQIFEAIVGRDGDTAARWMAEHIEETRTLIDSWLKSSRSRPAKDSTATRLSSRRRLR